MVASRVAMAEGRAVETVTTSLHTAGGVATGTKGERTTAAEAEDMALSPGMTPRTAATKAKRRPQ